MSSDQRLIFHADPEHTGIRLVVPLILFLGFFVGYGMMLLLFQLLFPETGGPDYLIFLACLGAVPLGLGLSALAEYGLKRTWRSGRWLALAGDRLELHRPGWPNRVVDLAAGMTVTCWGFQLTGYPRGGRERHLPSSWFCLSCQLEQDEERIIFFAFMPAAKAASWLERPSWPRIEQANLYEKSFWGRLGRPARPQLTAKLISSQEGRYWLAERNRWQEGVELTAADFETIVKHLKYEV